MNPVTDCLKEDREYGQFLETLKKELRGNPLPLLVNGLCEGAGDAFFLSVLQDLKDLGKPLSVIFCPDEKACVRLVNLLNASGIPALHYVDRDFTFYNITSSHDYEHERLHVLNSLLHGSCRAVVTTPNAALSLTLPPSVLSENSLRIDFETKIQPREFAAMLLQAGYSRVDLVDGIGQFSLRGDILDIFPPYGIYLDEDKVSHNGRSPIRIELFGDEVDRIGLFSIESQRVHTTLRSAEIPPSREILLTRQTVERIEKAVALQERQTQLPKASEELEKEKSACRFYLDNGSGELPFADKYISLIYPESCCLLDYFSSGITPVFLRGTAGIQERIHATQEKDRQQNADLLEGGTVAAKYVGYRKDAFTLSGWHFFWASESPDTMSYNDTGDQGNFKRGGCCCVLTHKATGIKLFFMNNHGCLNSGSNIQYAHVYVDMEQRYNKAGLPSFFVGDMNARESTVESSVYMTYSSWWKDSFKEVDTAHRTGSTNTFNGYTSPTGKYRIDYVFFRGSGFEPVQYCCDNTLYDGLYASDHFPVWVEFAFEK